MQSTQIQDEQLEAPVCSVGNSVGYLDTEVRDFLSCPWCGELLPASKTRPRMYCSEAHEKAFKRAGCVSKEKHQARKLVAANDAWNKLIRIPNQLGAIWTPYAEDKPKHLKDPMTVYTGPGCAGGPKNPEGKELGVVTLPPEPTKVLPEFWPLTPETPLFIGPLLKNGRKRGHV